MNEKNKQKLKPEFFNLIAQNAQKRYVENKSHKTCKNEQTKPGIKHSKNIHGLHQEDTLNIGCQ